MSSDLSPGGSERPPLRRVVAGVPGRDPEERSGVRSAHDANRPGAERPAATASAAGMPAAAVRSSQGAAAADTGRGPGVVPDRAGAGAPRASSPFIAKAAWADLLDWTEARGC
jgi:hypothetical protein